MARRFLTVLLFTALAVTAQAQPRLAIIIDDLGYHRARSEAIANLPGAITCAIIPGTPHAQRIAHHASQQRKEVLLHIPMEPPNNQPLDSGGLHQQMTRQQLQQAVRQAVQTMPQATGANNHMGGLLTTLEQPMDWLMEELAQHALFFIDSRTTEQSVAIKKAREHGIRYQVRDVFLDNERDLTSLNRQFNRALALARKRGHAILIGHPYPETIDYLSAVLPLLDQAGITLVPVSQLLRTPAPTTRRETHVSGTSPTATSRASM